MIKNLILATFISFGIGSPLSEPNEKNNTVFTIQANTNYIWNETVILPSEAVGVGINFTSNNTDYTYIGIATDAIYYVTADNQWSIPYTPTNGWTSQGNRQIKFNENVPQNLQNVLMQNLELSQEQTDLVNISMTKPLQDVSPATRDGEDYYINQRVEDVVDVQLDNSLNRNTKLWYQMQNYTKKYNIQTDEAVESYTLLESYIYAQYTPQQQTKFEGNIKQLLNVYYKSTILRGAANIDNVKINIEVKSASNQNYEWYEYFNWRNTRYQDFVNIQSAFSSLVGNDSYTYPSITLNAQSQLLGQDYIYNNTIQYDTTGIDNTCYIFTKITMDVYMTQTDNQFWASGQNTDINNRTLQAEFEYDLVINITQDIIDVPNIMFTVLTMPFTFISQAFNLSIFPGTPYSLNFGDTILFIVGSLILIFIVKMIARKL